MDRIVPGYSKEDEAQHISDQLGYHGKLQDTGEIMFHLWVIEGDRSFVQRSCMLSRNQAKRYGPMIAAALQNKEG